MSMKTVKVCASLFLLLSFGCGCSKDNGDPVAECRQYEAALDACFHRDSGFAERPEMIPKTKDDRERIRNVCSANLARIRAACR
jgi:hypothetical protein